MTTTNRAAALTAAHYNILNLDFQDVDVDLFSDVPRLSSSATVRNADLAISLGGVYAPALDEAASAIYGPARFVWAQRGRSVELAMAHALIEKGQTVLGNGLFRTTQHAFRRAGAEVELEPGAPSKAGTSDLDLKWIELRLAEGGVSWVCAESANNALGGWGQSLENLRAVRTLCDRHRARLLMDATRLLSGCLLMEPDRDPRVLAREMTALTDAYWVSCAKELLAPAGAFLAVRTLDAQRKAFNYTFDEGTWLDAHEPRIRLLHGLREIAADPQPLVRRRAQVELVAKTLRSEGVRILEPAGAHAVFVPVDAELLSGSPARARALESVLYEREGVRVLISPYPRMGYTAMMRLAVPVGQYEDEALVRAARAIAKLFRDPSGVYDLAEAPAGVESMHEMVKSYVRK